MSQTPSVTKIPIPCPLCEGEHSETILEPWVEVSDPVQLYGAASSVRGTQRLVRCKDCELIYENPRFPSEVILAGYAQSDEAGHDSQYEMRVETFVAALRKLVGDLPPPGSKVLDIGTASGAFLEAAGDFGYEAVGLDPSRSLVERGRQRGLEIHEGTLAERSFPSKSFDMVTLWDVLEHVADPKEFLRSIAEILRPGGVLLINYPDIGTLQARLAGRRFWWILSGHLVHFTPSTISVICEKTGFEAYQFRRYWQVLQLGYLEEMAIQLGVPMSRLIMRLTPRFLKRLPIPYYASQTTALARRMG